MNRQNRILPLTGRQETVLALASEGRSDKQIAEALGITEGDVMRQWAEIRLNLGVGSRNEAVAICLDLRRAVVVQEEVPMAANPESTELHRAQGGIDEAAKERTAEATSANKRLRAEMAEAEAGRQAPTASETQFRDIVEKSPAGYFFIDREGRFQSVNEAWLRMHKYDSAKEVLGRHFSLTQVEVDEWCAGTVVENALAGKALNHGEFSRRCKDGSIGWHTFTVAPVRRRGEVVGLEGFIIDITEHKRSEQALVESEARLRRAEVIARTGSWEIHLDSGIAHYSDGTASIYGIEGNTLPFKVLRAYGLKECRRGMEKALRHLVDDGILLDCEFKIRRRSDGAIVDVHALAEYDRERRIVFGVLQDVTQRKEAEQELRAGAEFHRSLFENMLNGLAYCRMLYKDGKPIDFVYLAVNDAFESITGLKDVIGKRVSEVIPDIRKTDPQIFEVYGRIAGTGRPERFEVYVSALGMWFSVSAYCPAPAYFVAVFDVVTERKMAEARLSELNESLEQRVGERTLQLQAALDELDSFSYSVSHDLRAPLRAVDGFSRMLLDDYGDRLDEAGRELLGRLRANAQQMDHLVDGLLALSRLSRSEMNRARIDLGLLAESVVARLREQHPDQAVECVIDPDLSADGDPVLVSAVLENLLGNAWKYTGKREGAQVIFGSLEKEGERVFFVRDNGAGFDQSRADRLFRAFERLHPAGEYPGTGIGLATVRRIVHRHGGRVWAEGIVDQGATFYFTLGREESDSSALG
jgi:PAS domain S-box-containing protein